MSKKPKYHLHKHDNDDALFFVIDSSITLETEKGNFQLSQNESVCVPKERIHRLVVK